MPVKGVQRPVCRHVYAHHISGPEQPARLYVSRAMIGREERLHSGRYRPLIGSLETFLGVLELFTLRPLGRQEVIARIPLCDLFKVASSRRKPVEDAERSKEQSCKISHPPLGAKVLGPHWELPLRA